MRWMRYLSQGLCLCTVWVLGMAAPAMAQTRTDSPQQVQGSGNWKQLKAEEQRALAPLSARWGELTETQRSKWRAIAQHFDRLSAAEQQVMQTRMAEWVALSPVQRNQARLNFNTVQGLAKDDKKTLWDEYQALSEAEKRKLSAGTLAPAKTAAPSAKPAAPDRLVQPTVRTLPSAALPARAPIDQKTLLPIPTPPTTNPPASADSAPVVAEPARESSGS